MKNPIFFLFREEKKHYVLTQKVDSCMIRGEWKFTHI